MTVSDISPPASDEGAAREPSYDFGRREAELVARFPSGKRVPVRRGRERAYPGLRGTAPSTVAFYEAFARFANGKHLLDAGSGSSIGTRVLCRAFPHVTAIDNDARALEFGREYAPAAEYLQADLCLGSSLDRIDAAFVIDVLGHLSHPEAALRSLRACLPVGSQLFVAEPRAYCSQRLLAPACRAFSERALKRLLLRSGFDVDHALDSGPSFVALVAHRAGEPALEALTEAVHQAHRGQFRAARAEFARAKASPRTDVKLEALLGEAEAAIAANDGDCAVRSYFEANELDPKDGRALAGLSRIALATDEIDDALRLSLESIARDPIDASAHALMGLAAEQLSHPEAFNAWRIAANLAPDAPEVATGLARSAAQRQNYAFAIQVFERLRGYNTTLSLEFHVTLGWLLLADGRRNDASVEARYATAIAPEHSAVTELVQAIEAS